MSKQHLTGRELTVVAMKILEKEGAPMGRTELFAAVENTTSLSKANWTKDAQGRISWKTQLNAHSTLWGGSYIKKDKSLRQWSLTEAGKEYLSSGARPGPDESDALLAGGEITQEQLDDDIANHINTVPAGQRNDGKKLEKIAAALLRGMGYRHVDECGGTGDGGVDVIAYKEVMGEKIPHLKVQAKHITTEDKIPSEKIQILESTLREGEIGVFITTSHFTPPAKKHAKKSPKHLILVNIDRLVGLWVKYYPSMSEEDKNLVPLKYALDIEKVKAAAESDSD